MILSKSAKPKYNFTTYDIALVFYSWCNGGRGQVYFIRLNEMNMITTCHFLLLTCPDSFTGERFSISFLEQYRCSNYCTKLLILAFIRKADVIRIIVLFILWPINTQRISVMICSQTKHNDSLNLPARVTTDTDH